MISVAFGPRTFCSWRSVSGDNAGVRGRGWGIGSVYRRGSVVTKWSQSRWTPPSRSAKLLIPLNGEMSEWLKEHAWKSTPAARADAHPVPPTHLRSTTFRNVDMRRRVPVNRYVCPVFEGVCDTVLTQCD